MIKRKPPCPGNEEDYVLVRTKEGEHWRRKRGSVKRATLNDSYRLANNLLKSLSPSAARIRSCLYPYLNNLNTGRLNIRIASALRKSIKETKSIQFRYLKGLQLQRDYPLDEMVKRFILKANESSIRIEIFIGDLNIIAQNKVATDYYFETVLVYGNINSKNGLKTESLVSPLYSFGNTSEGNCVLTLPKPKKSDWMVLLKINCHEENTIANHTKHYRMAVLEGR